MFLQTLMEAMGNLLASRQRSALALLGILIGSGAVIAMLNVGAMAQNETVKQFQQMGTDLISIRSSSSSGFSLADVQALTAASKNLSLTSPISSGSVSLIFNGVTVSSSAVGVTEVFAKLAKLRVGEGRLVSDFDRFEAYAVLGARLAADLSRSSPVRVGSDIRVGTYIFRVLSILDPVPSNPMLSIDINSSIFMSLPNARRVSPGATLSLVLARVAPRTDPEAVSAELTSYFNNRGRGSQVEIQTAQQLIAGMENQMRLFQLLLGVIGGISLVLGGVGVMNIMLISVQERHREIGIRLAIGARRRDIQSLFLSEAVVLSVLGGVLGILLGLVGSYAFARFSAWEFMLSPMAAPLGAGVSIAVGIFFGFYPAFMASRLDPIVALRSE